MDVSVRRVGFLGRVGLLDPGRSSTTKDRGEPGLQPLNMEAWPLPIQTSTSHPPPPISPTWTAFGALWALWTVS